MTKKLCIQAIAVAALGLGLTGLGATTASAAPDFSNVVGGSSSTEESMADVQKRVADEIFMTMRACS